MDEKLIVLVENSNEIIIFFVDPFPNNWKKVVVSKSNDFRKYRRWLSNLPVFMLRKYYLRYTGKKFFE